MNNPKTPHKILIVRLGSLGDIVHTVPTQQRLSRCFPDAEIHWVVEPPYDILLRHIPGISQVWLAATRKWRHHITSSFEIIHLVRSLRRERFTVALDFQGLLKSAVLARLSGARRIIGFAPERFKEPSAGYFYSETAVGDDGSKRHAVEINAQLARFLGCRENGIGPLVPLQIPSKSLHYVDQNLQKLKIEQPILINPGAGWVTKLWPAENYAQLSVRIEEELNLPTLFTFGPGEEDLMEKVRKAISPRPVASFPTDILQLAALCQRARLFVGGDTGPLHLAVALGTPTVAILGPTAAWRNGPFNSDDHVVKRQLFCSNSYKRTCDEFICMNIPVREVFDSVVQRLQTSPVNATDYSSSSQEHSDDPLGSAKDIGRL